MLHTNSSSTYDRYQAFSELESVDFVTAKDWDDDFGEFQSHLQISSNLPALLNPSTFIEESVPDSEICKRASKVVACCKQLVHRVFNLLVVNHDEMKVIEALRTERGKNFILDLAEVHKVSQRAAIFYQTKCGQEKKVVDMIYDVNVTWKTLKNIFAKIPVEIPENTEIHSVPEGTDRCCICYFPTDISSEEALLFAWRRYHSSCANLWLNCIDAVLPGSRPDVPNS
ncbi:synergin gamma-like [Brevipalpus obovatus]|uniref:synergin gamma-like n=1 Tax=Brevipalpus obovatus TaxID=246614 RepID=UPI003D9E7F94